MPRKASSAPTLGTKAIHAGDPEYIVPLDKFGVDIKVGDYIVWPVRRKSDMWLSTGVVLDIKMERAYTGEPYYSINVWMAGLLDTNVGETFVPRKTTVNTLERIVVLGKETVQKSKSPEIEILRHLVPLQ